MQFSSSLLENAVNEFAKLPGIGKKTALRMVLHLLKQDAKQVNHFSDVIAKMRSEIKFCHRCHNVADGDICSICANSVRKKETVCVVESIRDVIAIEGTQQYNRHLSCFRRRYFSIRWHWPRSTQYRIACTQRIAKEQIRGTHICPEPKHTGRYHHLLHSEKTTRHHNPHHDHFPRRVAFGGELEYADEHTLGRSLQNRMPVEKYVTPLRATFSCTALVYIQLIRLSFAAVLQADLFIVRPTELINVSKNSPHRIFQRLIVQGL
jgi:recombination protein RecR